MSVEEWKDESNAIPAGEITLPSKEEIEKRNEAMTDSQSAAIAVIQELQEKRRAFKESFEEAEIIEGELIIKPVYYRQELEVFFVVIPIKRKLNRYSKKYIKKLVIRAPGLAKAKDSNKEQTA